MAYVPTRSSGRTTTRDRVVNVLTLTSRETLLFRRNGTDRAGKTVTAER